MLLLCCWPVRKKLLFIRHLDLKGELEQKKSHPSSSNPGFAPGLVPGCSYREAFCGCFAGVYCFQIPKTFQAYSTQCFLAELIWLQAPIYMRHRDGKHRPLSELAGKGRPGFFNPRAEFGAGRSILSTETHAQLCS